jgi:hypothetical protein
MSLADLASSTKHRVTLVAEVVGGALGIAYLNHSMGGGEIKLFAQQDGSGGVPLDGALGLLGIGYAFLRPGSRWAKHSLGLGMGLASGYAYRAGAVMGDAAASKSATAGNIPQITARPVPQLAPHFAKFAVPQTAARVAVSK